MSEKVDKIASLISEEDLYDLNNMFPVRVTDYMTQTPTPAQHLALSLNVNELFWGGSAGGGKLISIQTVVARWANPLGIVGAELGNGLEVVHSGDPRYSGRNTTTIDWNNVALESARLKDIHVGDYIPDQDGNPVMVVAKSEYEYEPTYRLTTVDGEEIVCGENHLWNIATDKDRIAFTRAHPEWKAARRAKRASRGIATKVGGLGTGGGGTIAAAKATAEANRKRAEEARANEVDPYIWDYTQTVDTKTLAKLVSTEKKRVAIPVAGAVKHGNTWPSTTNVTPYFLGFWLGDGTASSGELTQNPNILPDGSCDADTMRILLAEENILVSQNPKCLKNFKVTMLRSGLSARKELAPLGLLQNKHIPEWVFGTDYESRLSVLQGIVDTDGHINNRGQLEMCMTNERLMRDIKRLMSTLGLRTGWSESEAAYTKNGIRKVTGTRYTIKCTPTIPVARFPRKLKNLNLQKNRSDMRNSYRYIESVELLDEQPPLQCIQVDDPRGLYCIGETNLVTHNSSYLLQSALQYALSLDTKVPTPNGWTTIGELSVGDLLYGPDGQETSITALTETYQGDNYEITFKNGETVVADAEHLWFVSDHTDRNTNAPTYAGIRRSGQVKSTREICESQSYRSGARTHKEWSVPRTQPVQGRNEELPLDPYLFGLWLGDGSKRDGTIAGTSTDNVRQAFVNAGFDCTPYKGNRFHAKGLRTILGSMGVRNNKHVPEVYMRASLEQRLELLRGLMDSDGTVSRKYGHVRFFNTDWNLVSAVVELMSSIGLNPTYTLQKYKRLKGEDGHGWVVDTTSHIRLFNLDRKARLQKIKPTRELIITDVRKVSSSPVKCVTVDNDSHLFLITESWIPTHNCDVPGYSALLLRRTWNDLIQPEGLVDRMDKILSGTDVKKRDEGRKWVFPSGAMVSFGYAQRDDNKHKFAGGEYQFIGFDEATHFEPTIYTFLQSRLRRPQLFCLVCKFPLKRYYDKHGNVQYSHLDDKSRDYREEECSHPIPDPQVLQRFHPAAQDGMTIFDVPLRMRAASNPGSLSHQFFKERFVSEEPKHKAERLREGRVFIPAALDDNPYVDRENYRKQLEKMNPVDRARLLNGDWDVMMSGGLFERGQFNQSEGYRQDYTVEDCKSVIRAWDLAASENEKADYTVGALCGITKDNRWVVLDLKRFRKRPHDVEQMILKTAQEDGQKVPIIMEQEPGSSGKNNISNYARNILPGYRFRGIRSTGSKEVRAEPLAAQVAVGNVYLNSGSWVGDFLDEAQSFPDSLHDDQIDAVCLGFSQLALQSRIRILAR